MINKSKNREIYELRIEHITNEPFAVRIIDNGQFLKTIEIKELYVYSIFKIETTYTGTPENYSGDENVEIIYGLGDIPFKIGISDVGFIFEIKNSLIPKDDEISDKITLKNLYFDSLTSALHKRIILLKAKKRKLGIDKKIKASNDSRANIKMSGGEKFREFEKEVEKIMGKKSYSDTKMKVLSRKGNVVNETEFLNKQDKLLEIYKDFENKNLMNITFQEYVSKQKNKKIIIVLILTLLISISLILIL